MDKLTFKQAIELAYRRVKDWEGRSGRAEFWWFVLFYFIVAIILSLLAGEDGPGFALGLLAFVVTLVNFIVMLAAAVRRLHDTGRSGWWVLLGLIPIIGTIILIIWYAQKGDPLPNRYGAPHELPGIKIEIL